MIVEYLWLFQKINNRQLLYYVFRIDFTRYYLIDFIKYFLAKMIKKEAKKETKKPSVTTPSTPVKSTKK